MKITDLQPDTANANKGTDRGRKCYGLEIDPHYCDVIVNRWEQFTGNKAQKS